MKLWIYFAVFALILFSVSIHNVSAQNAECVAECKNLPDVKEWGELRRDAWCDSKCASKAAWSSIKSGWASVKNWFGR